MGCFLLLFCPEAPRTEGFGAILSARVRVPTWVLGGLGFFAVSGGFATSLGDLKPGLVLWV